jgi:RNA polymerase sigma-70 factor (ECF subfamily)
MGDRIDEGARLAELFEERRGRLRAVAYRMLGSLPEADDAVQNAWVRFSRAGTEGVDNVSGLLTTIVARVCLNMLRARSTRREELVGVHMPDPVVTSGDSASPENELLLADSVGLALFVVLDTLTPAERLAFVLHDVFDVPFDEIAPLVRRSTVAARQLASRARRRVRGAEVRTPDADVATQRAVVNAFFAAARDGDFDGLVTVLDPDVVLRADGGAAHPRASALLHGAAAVAGRALMFAQPAMEVSPALVNGTAGVIITAVGRPVAVLGFTVVDGRVTEINGITDPDRLTGLGLGGYS